MNIETNQTMSQGVPVQLPESYKKAMQETSSLLEQLFGVGNTVTLEASIIPGNSGETSEVLKTLLHFLDVYIEIFDYSAKQQKQGSPTTPVTAVFKGDSPVLQQCITKLREIWRQGFRGFQYLPEKKLELVWKRAEFETLSKLSSFQNENTEMEETLKKVVQLEQSWIKRINEHKRNKDLEVIQIEAVEKFKTDVVTEFPYLFDDDGKGNNFRHCEDNYFEWKLGELIKKCKNNFQADIPFKAEEKEDVVKSVLDQLNAKLEENVITDLRSRNDSKKIVIRDYMDSLVVKCVENYRNSVTTAVLGEDEEESTQVQYETETILELHKKLIQEFTPKFVVTENGIEIGSKEYQVKCLNSFNSQTYEIFKKLVETLNNNCETNMVACHQETKEEIQTCLAKVTDILGRYGGMIGYSNELRSKFEGGLNSVFSQTKDVNRLNKDLLLTATKPVHIQTNEEVQFKLLREKCKKIYTDKLLSVLKTSSKFPNSKDTILLDQCHQEAKISAIKFIDSTNSDLLPPYLSFELKSKFTSYVAHFITKAKANSKKIIEPISGILRTSVPFRAVEGTDMEMLNGAAAQINTRHQFITAMKEYENKSFEELHLEDKRNITLSGEKIMKLLEQSVSYFEMYEDFRKSLKLSKSGSSLTNKPFQFSSQSMSSTQSFLLFNTEFQSSTNASSKPRRVTKALRRFKK